MIAARHLVLVAIVLSLAAMLPAQDSRDTVIMSGPDGTRLEKTLLRPTGARQTAWLPLDDGGRGPRPNASESRPVATHETSPRDTWLIATVRERFPGIAAVEAVERTTSRFDGTMRTVSSENGIEARGPAEVVGRVQEFFDRFTAGSRKVVTIEVHVVETDTEPGARTSAEIMSRQAWEDRLREVRQRQAGDPQLATPTLKVFANQAAALTIGDQISYIKDYTVGEVQGVQIADPVIDVLHDGIAIELTPVYDPDQNAIILGGKIEFSHVTRPMRQYTTKLVKSSETELTIQLPEVVTRRWQGEVRLGVPEGIVRITGLKHPRSSEKPVPVEVWCIVTVNEGAATLATGEIVDRDTKYGNVFVAFPRDYVPDEPWDKAPKEVTVYRGSGKIGAARLNGGWVLPDSPHPVIAIYHLAKGTPNDGDSVR